MDARFFSGNELTSPLVAAETDDCGWVVVDRQDATLSLGLLASDLCARLVQGQHKIVSINTDDYDDDCQDGWVLVDTPASGDSEASPTLKSRFMDSLILIEAGYNLVITFTEATYTSAVIITSAAGLNGGVIGLAYPAIAISIPIGMLLAAAETHAHRAESEHFDRAAKDSESTPLIAASDKSLTWGQSISSLVHYFADIYKGAAVPLLFAKLVGLDTASNAIKITTYLGTGVISVLGNLREYVNTRVAFEEENKRDTAAASKSLSPK